MAFGSGGSVQFTGTPDSGQALSINGSPTRLVYSDERFAEHQSTETCRANYALGKAARCDWDEQNWTPIGTNESGGR